MRSVLGVFAALGASLMLVQGCKPKASSGSTPQQQPAAFRVAASFVHCVEFGKAQCVDVGQESRGWNALFLLSWLGSGSPPAILDGLPTQLASHQNSRAVQARFVEEVERHATELRGAGCEPERAEPFEPLIDDAAAGAAKRMNSFGLLRQDMQAVIDRLVVEAREDLQGGHLVHMQCGHDPYRFYLAVRGDENQSPAVVGMTTLWPMHLGGQPLDSKTVESRLRSRTLNLPSARVALSENTVHPWLPFPVEEF